MGSKQLQSLQELFESRIPLVEGSTKAGWLSLKALRKWDGFNWKQDGFRCKVYERRMAFVERSTKARWLLLKAIQKQDGFRWNVYKSRMAFVERSTKASWLYLKALGKQDWFRWKLYKSRMPPLSGKYAKWENALKKPSMWVFLLD